MADFDAARGDTNAGGGGGARVTVVFVLLQRWPTIEFPGEHTQNYRF